MHRFQTNDQASVLLSDKDLPVLDPVRYHSEWNRFRDS